MRKLLSLCLLVSALSANAGTPGQKCAEGLAAGTDAFHHEIATCVATEPSFAKAADWMCNADGSAPSDEYQAYDQYRNEMNDLFAQSKDPANAQNKTLIYEEMRQKDRDWSLFGFKAEIESSLPFLVSAVRGCL